MKAPSYLVIILMGILCMPTLILAAVTCVSISTAAPYNNQVYLPGQTITVRGTTSYVSCNNNTSSVTMTITTDFGQTKSLGVVASGYDTGGEAWVTYNSPTFTTSLTAPTTPGNYNVTFNSYVTSASSVCHGHRKSVTVPIQVIAPTNGTCGSASSTSSYSFPSSAAACSQGTLTATSTVGSNFLWTCSGLNGGTNASCTGPKKIDGVCTYPPAGLTTYSAPTPACTTGTPSSPATLTGTFPSQSYQWTCSATNGGIIPTCSAPKSPCASGQTLCNSTCIPTGDACIDPGVRINSFYFRPSITGSSTCPAFWSTTLTGTGGDPILATCSLNGTSVASSSSVGYPAKAGNYTLTCTYNNVSTTATSTVSRCSNAPSYIEN